MSQQEFELRQQQADDEIYRPQYPYNWSDEHEEGMPRDESPGNYDAPGGQTKQEQAGYQNNRGGQAQVPWWARPQSQQHGSRTFMLIVASALLIVLITGALGIAGVVLGALAHLLGVLLGAIFVLLIFLFVLVFLVLALISRALGRAFGYDRRAWHNQRRAQRRAARNARRMARRSW